MIIEVMEWNGRFFRTAWIFAGSMALSAAAWAGAKAFGVDSDLPNAPGLRATKEEAPRPITGGWFDAADSVLSLIPSTKLNCVKDVIGKTLLAKSSTSGNDAIWKSNAGVKAYNQLRLSRSPCLAVLTERYYKDLKALGASAGRSSDRVNEGRPALNAKLGQGTFSEQQPGFALKSAMELAQGNRALAMAMIGHCGHDDIENTLPTVVDFAKAGPSKSALMGYLQGLSAGRTEKARANPHSNLNQLIAAVENNGRASLTIDCPYKSSSFYAPGALGADVDMSEEQKRRIASVQAPTKGAGALPAKAYHTSFAAVMGCRLGACGLSPESSAKLLSTIANRYRTARQVATTDKYEAVRAMIEDRFDLNWSDTQTLKRREAAIRGWLESEEARKAIIAAGGEEFFAQNRARLSWETWRRNIDATVLTRGGPAGQVWNAPPLSAGRDPFYSGAGASRPQTSYCPGWPEERCTEARGHRDTWAMDFEWTEAQQTVGGNFGAKFCAGQPSTDEGVEAQACQALQRLDATPAAAPGPEGTPAGGVE